MSDNKMREAFKAHYGWDFSDPDCVVEAHAWHAAWQAVLAQSDQRGEVVDLAAIVHYPDHWDTAAYPDAASALREALFVVGCSECKNAPPAPVVPELLDDTSLRAVIGRIGNEVHNLSCEQTSDDRLASRLSEIAGDLWKLAQQASPAPVVPEGWKLVPERLTPQMGHAGDATLDDDGSMQAMWTNMLAAAPEVPRG